MAGREASGDGAGVEGDVGRSGTEWEREQGAEGADGQVRGHGWHFVGSRVLCARGRIGMCRLISRMESGDAVLMSW